MVRQGPREDLLTLLQTNRYPIQTASDRARIQDLTDHLYLAASSGFEPDIYTAIILLVQQLPPRSCPANAR
jgi:hypothetical protein